MQLDAPAPLQGIAPVELPAGVSAGEADAALVMGSAEGSPDSAEGSRLSAEGSPPSRSTQEKAESEQAPGLDEQGIPIAWTLQVVSVGKQEKAEDLVQQLLDMRYKAYFKAISHGEGTLYRVYVGPKFDRGKVEAAKLVVDKKFRVNSIVTRYLP
jgi:DedD protein